MISCSQTGIKVLIPASLIFLKWNAAAFSMLLVDANRPCFCPNSAQNPGVDPGGGSGDPLSAGDHFHVPGSIADQQPQKFPESNTTAEDGAFAGQPSANPPWPECFPGSPGMRFQTLEC